MVFFAIRWYFRHCFQVGLEFGLCIFRIRVKASTKTHVTPNKGLLPSVDFHSGVEMPTKRICSLWEYVPLENPPQKTLVQIWLLL